jgi:prepilin-type N-terminal cleavage/methylation domain-containing protein
MDLISTNTDPTSKRNDKGFTLVELLIVIVILGILASVTVFAVRGITDRGTTTACQSERKTLQTAVEAYYAQFGNGTGIATAAYAASASTGNTASAAVAVPSVTPAVTWSAGANPKATLTNAGFLKANTNNNFFVTPAGAIISLNAACGTVNSVVG